MSALPAAFGFCADCETVHSLPVGNSRKHALELMQQLDEFKRLDSLPGSNHQSEIISHKFSTDYLWSEARGHMFGVLECEDAEGTPVVLKAFSGQYNGRWFVDGWVPPILDTEDFYRVSTPVDHEIKLLNRFIAEQKNPELIRKRKALSQQLMKEIHALYRLTNFHGETRPLTHVFRGGIPTGAGDCCAPKLLNHAALNGLKPIGLSEFYWGRENKSGTRRHKQFYPACAEKCQPILGFMLCGMETFSTAKNTKKSQKAIQIIFEDCEFVVVNKPSGLLAVPGKGPENQDCVTARIKALYPHCIKQPEVHRLDMDTSGLMVLALTADAHRELSRQFHDRETEKRYIALLDGEPAEESGTLELPFRLDVENRPVQIYDPVHGKIGITRWKKLSVENGQTRIEFRPVTGRTHQLRIHAASEYGLGVPIVGDRLYGSGIAPGQLKLHASYLSFTHPRTGEKLEFLSEPAF
ncbi:MAG: tRNA pseudouridine32 synthase / rRNA pseudouridine746 synthase [Verrucomicrobiota bacterium]|nr:tRNA pseudouridine32 synthase / rRNA pseudouridine746 synthase [Verrucomicrobiota bacterium]